MREREEKVETNGKGAKMFLDDFLIRGQFLTQISVVSLNMIKINSPLVCFQIFSFSKLQTH